MKYGECRYALIFIDCVSFEFGVKNEFWFLIKQKGVLVKWFLPDIPSGDVGAGASPRV